MPSKLSTTRLTDLCCCINAYEGYCMTYPNSCEDEKNPLKVQERRRQALYDAMMAEADTLYNGGVSLKRLSKAINAAGWGDQKMVRRKYELAIVPA